MEQILTATLTSINTPTIHLIVRTHPDTPQDQTNLHSILKHTLRVKIDTQQVDDRHLAQHHIQVIAVYQSDGKPKYQEQLYCGEYQPSVVHLLAHLLPLSPISNQPPVALTLAPYLPKYQSTKKHLLPCQHKPYDRSVKEEKRMFHYQSREASREMSLINQSSSRVKSGQGRRCYCCNNSEAEQNSRFKGIHFRTNRKSLHRKSPTQQGLPSTNTQEKLFSQSIKSNKEQNTKRNTGKTERINNFQPFSPYSSVMNLPNTARISNHIGSFTTTQQPSISNRNAPSSLCPSGLTGHRNNAYQIPTKRNKQNSSRPLVGNVKNSSRPSTGQLINRGKNKGESSEKVKQVQQTYTPLFRKNSVHCNNNITQNSRRLLSPSPQQNKLMAPVVPMKTDQLNKNVIGKEGQLNKVQVQQRYSYISAPMPKRSLNTQNSDEDGYRGINKCLQLKGGKRSNFERSTDKIMIIKNTRKDLVKVVAHPSYRPNSSSIKEPPLKGLSNIPITFQKKSQEATGSTRIKKFTTTQQKQLMHNNNKSYHLSFRKQQEQPQISNQTGQHSSINPHQYVSQEVELKHQQPDQLSGKESESERQGQRLEKGRYSVGVRKGLKMRCTDEVLTNKKAKHADDYTFEPLQCQIQKQFKQQDSIQNADGLLTIDRPSGASNQPEQCLGAIINKEQSIKNPFPSMKCSAKQSSDSVLPYNNITSDDTVVQRIPTIVYILGSGTLSPQVDLQEEVLSATLIKQPSIKLQNQKKQAVAQQMKVVNTVHWEGRSSSDGSDPLDLNEEEQIKIEEQTLKCLFLSQQTQQQYPPHNTSPLLSRQQEQQQQQPVQISLRRVCTQVQTVKDISSAQCLPNELDQDSEMMNGSAMEQSAVEEDLIHSQHVVGVQEGLIGSQDIIQSQEEDLLDGDEELYAGGQNVVVGGGQNVVIAGGQNVVIGGAKNVGVVDRLGEGVGQQCVLMCEAEDDGGIDEAGGKGCVIKGQVQQSVVQPQYPSAPSQKQLQWPHTKVVHIQISQGLNKQHMQRQQQYEEHDLVIQEQHKEPISIMKQRNSSASCSERSSHQLLQLLQQGQADEGISGTAKEQQPYTGSTHPTPIIHTPNYEDQSFQSPQQHASLEAQSQGQVSECGKSGQREVECRTDKTQQRMVQISNEPYSSHPVQLHPQPTNYLSVDKAEEKQQQQSSHLEDSQIKQHIPTQHQQQNLQINKPIEQTLVSNQLGVEEKCQQVGQTITNQTQSICIQTDELLPTYQEPNSPPNSSAIQQAEVEQQEKRPILTKIMRCGPQTMQFSSILQTNSQGESQLQNNEEKEEKSREQQLVDSELTEEQIQAIVLPVFVSAKTKEEVGCFQEETQNQNRGNASTEQLLEENEEQTIGLPGSHEERAQSLQQQSCKLSTVELLAQPVELIAQSQEDTLPPIVHHIKTTKIPTINLSSLQLSVGSNSVIEKGIAFINYYLPNYLQLLNNNSMTKMCLFINQQWTLVQKCIDQSTTHLLIALCIHLSIDSSLVTVYQVLEWLTAVPIRILQDKDESKCSKRLLRSVQHLIQQQKNQKYQVSNYGLTKYTDDIMMARNIRHFLGQKKVKQTIIECCYLDQKEGNVVERQSNICGSAVDKITQFNLLKNPYFSILDIGQKINTFEAELPPCVLYLQHPAVFLLYQQTQSNQYTLIKQSHSWLKYSATKTFTKILLIVEPRDEGRSELLVKIGLREGEVMRDIDWLRQEDVCKASCHLGGYQNKLSLYMPVVKELKRTKKRPSSTMKSS